MLRGAARLAVWLVAVQSVVPAAAYFEANPKMIEGVPIYNYHLARLARVGHSPPDELAFIEMMEDTSNSSQHPKEADDIEWIIVMQDSSTDKEVDDLCHESSAQGCLSEGHPTQHGIPVAGVKATIGGLQKLLKNHSKEVRHVEPNLPIFIPPTEAHIGKTSSMTEKEAEQSLLEESLQADKFYVMRYIIKGFVKGIEYSDLSSAEDQFEVWSQESDPIMIVDFNFQEIKYNAGSTQLSKFEILKDYEDWWKEYTGRTPKKKGTPWNEGPATPAPPPVAPSPPPTEAPGQRAPMPDGNTRRRRTTPHKEPTFWGLDRIDDVKGLDKSYDSMYDGHGVHIYVLDTGIKYDHTDFELTENGETKSRAIPTIEMWDNKPVECVGEADPTCAVDRFGHGTHCAGSAAGEFSGVAKGATIHAVKVLGDDGRGSDLGVAMAVDWIMRKGKRPAVLSMSLGRRGKSETMATVLKKATDSGLTIVVAAGNENSDACGNSPAFVPEVITVGATTKEDSKADFSNYGECLDVWAPGKSIKSAYYAGVARFGTMSGTSMACPHVAGWVAQVLQANPNMKPAEVKALLKQDSIKDKMLDNGGRGSPDRMLYVNPKPSWAVARKAPRKPAAGRRRRRRSSSKPKPTPPGTKPPESGPARRRRRRANPPGTAPTRRRRRGSKGPGRRRSPRRREATPSPTPPPTPPPTSAPTPAPPGKRRRRR